jgi:hypothetical protein
VRSARLLETIVAIILLLCETALASDAYVILVRGWFGVFSKSLDSIANSSGLKTLKPRSPDT